jgi:phosphoserine aminotransferase
MANRIWNFNPGPATLPLPVLEKMKADLPNYAGTGMAVMELSHRSKEYAAIHADAKSLLRELFIIPENHHILFLQGGASLQFAMVPMNLLGEGKSADYISTGSWSKKAIKEAKLFGNVNIAGSSEEAKFTFIPKDLKLDPNAQYVHITSNNTIAGTQWATFPNTGNIPLVADMSSDIMCKKINVSKFGLIYAGAQKNLGPSGVTVVIIRDDIAVKCREDITTMLKYKTHIENDSLFNTPPTYSIYILKLVLEYVKSIGGLNAVEKENNEKAKLLYGTIDSNKEFFRCPVKEDSRSIMNVVFRLPSEDLEAKFIADAKAAGFGGLKGHRSVGGIRVSMYNAMPLKGIQELTKFMKDFAQKNG